MSLSSSASPSQEQEKPESLTVLVVDDDVTVCNVVCEIMETQGFISYPAYSAAEALTFLEENTPDLILTDLMMPDIDGLTLIYKIRSASRSKRVPIVVISAIATTADRKAALTAGASAFLAKPFSSRELKEIIRTLIPPFKR